MQLEYYGRSTGTTITSAFLTLLTPVLWPVETHKMPPLSLGESYAYHKPYLDKYQISIGSVEMAKVENPIVVFATKLLADSREEDREIARLSNEGFWEIYEDF